MTFQEKQQTISWAAVPTGMGKSIIITTDKGLCWVGTPGKSLDDGLAWIRRHRIFGSVIHDEKNPILQEASDQLTRYFTGEHVQFSCPLDLYGTVFQKNVWLASQHIVYGRTVTYGALALAINHPLASRAVGAALGANPISIIIPCHRIIGANGKLTGYAGGLSTKSWLLSLEADKKHGTVL